MSYICVSIDHVVWIEYRKDMWGNQDATSLYEHTLSPPINVRYIRVLPKNFVIWVAMKVGVKVCSNEAKEGNLRLVGLENQYAGNLRFNCL